MELSFWLVPSTIFLTVHGSKAYGLAHSHSDLDVKGICIPPPLVRDNLFQGFEQAENAPEINTHKQITQCINPTNPKVESTVYSLRKFFKLASEVNPNVIELLYTEPTDWLFWHDNIWGLLYDIRDQFLSSRAKFTFTGYAIAQLNKINRHRKWLLNPVKDKPKRSDFGLAEEKPRVVETVTREIKRLVEQWNFHNYSLDDLQRAELKEACWLMIESVSGNKVNWDNWPEHYREAALTKLCDQLNLDDSIKQVLAREQLYQQAADAAKSYENWFLGRNPERKVLEEKFGFDVKHASHLVRLLRMGLEVLTGKGVIVKRPDAEELIGIRNGKWTYEQLLDYANKMDAEIEVAYKTTKLPRSVDYVKLNEHYRNLLDYWAIIWKP